MKTIELTGSALDWAAAKCEKPVKGYKPWVQKDLDIGVLHGMHYSTDWLWSGPIIERERITIDAGQHGALWIARKGAHECIGPTPLIAAMRCYAASKLGDTVDVPPELQ